MTLNTIIFALIIDLSLTLAHYFIWVNIFSKNFNIALSSLQAIVTIFLLIMLTRHTGIRNIYTFKYKSVLKGILYSLLYIFISFIVTSIAVQVTYFDANSVSKIFFSTIIFYAIWAFSEELLFRGIIFSYFMQKKKIFLGIFISSILFSLSHGLRYLYDDSFQPIWFLTSFFSGNVYATIFLLTGNIWSASIAHFLGNFSLALSPTGDENFNSTVTGILILCYYWSESLSPVLLVLIEKYVFKGRRIAQRFPTKSYIITITLFFIFLVSISYIIYLLS